ncbi:hypothetical protein ABPG72_018457, partial [Tetrahymena utriculariae]
ENEPVEVYLKIDNQVNLFTCNIKLGIILKATTDAYINFREKILLYLDQIEVIEQSTTVWQNNNHNIQTNNYNQDLQQNMDYLNYDLSLYSELIERQGKVEEGLTNTIEYYFKRRKKEEIKYIKRKVHRLKMKLFQAMWTRTIYSIGRMVRETGLALDRYGCKLEQDISCYEPLSRHRNILPIYDLVPTFYHSTFIAPNSSLIGAVYLGQNTVVGYGSTLRADNHAIRVGHNTVIGDKVAVSNVATLAAGIPVSTNIGNHVNIGSGCVLQSCVVDDNATVGHNTVVLEGSVLERGCVVAPNSLVPAGRLIPSGQLWAGSPVRYVRDLKEEEIKLNLEQTEQNLQLGKVHKSSLIQQEAYDRLLA